MLMRIHFPVPALACVWCCPQAAPTALLFCVSMCVLWLKMKGLCAVLCHCLLKCAVAGAHAQQSVKRAHTF